MAETNNPHDGGCLLRTFGRPELADGDDQPIESLRKKDLGLLIYLCLQGPRTHSRIALAELLWSDAPEEKARQSLTQALGRLRAVLPPGSLSLGQETVDWRGGLACDALELEAAGGDARTPVDVLPGWSSPFLEDFEPGKGAQAFSLWADGRRTALRSIVVGLLDGLGAAAEAREEWGDALKLGIRLVEVEPIFEEGQRRVMRAWAALGERTLALRHYEEFVQWLASEVEEEPDPATTSLAVQLRTAGRQSPRAEGEAPQEDPGGAGGMAASPPDLERAIRPSGMPRVVRDEGGGADRTAEPVAAFVRAAAPETRGGEAPHQDEPADSGAPAFRRHDPPDPHHEPSAGHQWWVQGILATRRGALATAAGIALVSAAIGFWLRGLEGLRFGSMASAAVPANEADERIFFVSDRLGPPRLFSMQLDGTDVELVADDGMRNERKWDPLESTCRHASLSIL